MLCCVALLYDVVAALSLALLSLLSLVALTVLSLLLLLLLLLPLPHLPRKAVCALQHAAVGALHAELGGGLGGGG
jgi:hypothetical protein